MRKNSTEKKAFSLLELLYILVIISAITAAFVPIFNKRLNHPKNEKFVTKARLFTYNLSDDQCQTSSSYANTLECKFTVPNNVSSLSAMMMAGGGGGAGASSPAMVYNKEFASETQGKKELVITREMRNFRIELLRKKGLRHPYIENYEIADSIIQNNIGGKVKIYIATGGAGDKNSSVEVLNASGAKIWGLYVATPDDTTEANTVLLKSCKLYKDGKTFDMECSGVNDETEATYIEETKVLYDMNYFSAPGSGGGGGSYATVDNMTVSPGSQFTIYVGKGGNGGAVGGNGEEGGRSGFTIGSTYTALGGKGGLKGTSAANASSAPTLAGAGAGGTFSTNSGGTNYFYTNGGAGSQGVVGASIATGGNGGTSGLKVMDSCGGLYSNISVCVNENADGHTELVTYPEITHDGIEKGKAGAGGAGGGFSFDTTKYPAPGGGSAGQDGFVFLYWKEPV